VTASTASFTPPNRDDYVFGEWTPWWGWHALVGRRHGVQLRRRGWGVVERTRARPTRSAATCCTWTSSPPSRPADVSDGERVGDGRQPPGLDRVGQSAGAPVDAVRRRQDQEAVRRQGQPIELAVIGVDLDGKAAIGTKPCRSRPYREETTWKKGAYVTEEKDPQVCNLVAGRGEGACVLPDPGRRHVQDHVATLRDKAGRPNQTTMTVWVTGGDVVPQRDLQARSRSRSSPTSRRTRPVTRPS
jgi:hypothetical protein